MAEETTIIEKKLPREPDLQKEAHPGPGKPTVMTQLVLSKLEDAFMIGLSDRKACEYAGISQSVLYRFQEKYPEYKERKEGLKLRPDIMAQKTIVSKLDSDVNVAWRWLEKRDPEFGEKNVLGTIVHEHTISVATQKGIEAYRKQRRLEIEAVIKKKAEEERARALPVISTVVVEEKKNG